MAPVLVISFLHKCCRCMTKSHDVLKYFWMPNLFVICTTRRDLHGTDIGALAIDYCAFLASAPISFLTCGALCSPAGVLTYE